MNTKSSSGLKLRAATALVLAPLGIAAIVLLPTLYFAALLGLVFAIGLREWARLCGFKSLPIQIGYAAVGAGLMALSWFKGRDACFFIAQIGAAFWILALIWLRFFSWGSKPSTLTVSAKMLAGALAIIPAWAAGVWLHASPDRGPLWLLFVIVLIWCADVFAYFSGRQFGKRKLAPRISPGKTWAGVYGAFAGGAVYAAICGWLLGMRGTSWLQLVVLCIATVAVSILGDLFESLIKRHSGAKDSGQLFPGHGGALDRFDSLFAALPFFVVGKNLIGS